MLLAVLYLQPVPLPSVYVLVLQSAQTAVLSVVRVVIAWPSVVTVRVKWTMDWIKCSSQIN